MDNAAKDTFFHTPRLTKTVLTKGRKQERKTERIVLFWLVFCFGGFLARRCQSNDSRRR